MAAGNVGLYNIVLTCSGGGSLSGNSVSVDTTAANVVCTYTNTARRADLSVSKTNTPLAGPNDQATDTVTRGAATSYSIVVRNAGPDAADGAVLRDPLPVGLNCTTASCGSPAGGAVCPAAGALTVVALQSAGGVTIPTLPANASLTVTLACTVQ